MEITYAFDRKPTAGQFAQVFAESGIRRPHEDLVRMQQMLDRCDILATAWAGQQLVGVARTLTDFVFCAYLSDLAISLNHQKQGIGRALVELTRTRLSDQVALILLAAPTANEYYAKIGFEHQPRCWVINRKT